MNWAQWTLVVLIVLNFLSAIHQSYNGRPALKPLGFTGVVGSILGISFRVWIFWEAGLFMTHR
jgi:hypothetical protein